MLSDSFNNILNQLELIEVWIDYDNKKYKIHSKTNGLILEGKFYAYDGGTAGERYYCYIGNSKQKLTLSTVRCAHCKDDAESLEINGGDDFYVSFFFTKRF